MVNRTRTASCSRYWSTRSANPGSPSSSRHYRRRSCRRRSCRRRSCRRRSPRRRYPLPTTPRPRRVGRDPRRTPPPRPGGRRARRARDCHLSVQSRLDTLVLVEGVQLLGPEEPPARLTARRERRVPSLDEMEPETTLPAQRTRTSRAPRRPVPVRSTFRTRTRPFSCGCVTFTRFNVRAAGDWGFVSVNGSNLGSPAPRGSKPVRLRAVTHGPPRRRRVWTRVFSLAWPGCSAFWERRGCSGGRPDLARWGRTSACPSRTRGWHLSSPWDSGTRVGRPRRRDDGRAGAGDECDASTPDE